MSLRVYLSGLVALPQVLGDGVTTYAKTGTCENIATGEQRCALQASDCEPSHIDGERNINGERWYNAYRMEQRGFAPCTCETTPIGACFIGEAGLDSSGADLNFRCAPHPESCFLSKGERFGLVDNLPFEDAAQCGCSVLGVLDEWHPERTYVGSAEPRPPAQSATLYGACYKDSIDHFCAFSPSDCDGAEEGYTWLDPKSASDLLGYDCTCADTHVGGCVGGFMGFTCAVTAEDCSWDSYLPPLKLKKTHGYNCRLCKPIMDQIREDVIDSLIYVDESSNVIAGTIGGAIGALVGVLVTLIAVFLCKKCQSKGGDSVKTAMNSDTTSVA